MSATPEAGFSGYVDHFGLAGTDLVVHESSLSPHAKGAEPAQDDKDIIVDMGYYVGGPGKQAEVTYHLKSGTLNLNTLNVGLQTATPVTAIIQSISVETNKGAWPTITVSGIVDCSPAPVGSKHTLPSITLNGQKNAQAMGLTITGTDVNLQSATLSFEGNIEHILADKDTIGGIGFSGCSGSASVEYLVRDAVTGASKTLTDFEITQAPASSGGITSWTTATAEAQGYLPADA